MTSGWLPADRREAPLIVGRDRGGRPRDPKARIHEDEGRHARLARKIDAGAEEVADKKSFRAGATMSGSSERDLRSCPSEFDCPYGPTTPSVAGVVGP